MAVLILVMSFVAGHAFGNGVACWVIISEIYPTKVRGRGMSIATTALWLVGYLGNQLFPIMQKTFGLGWHVLVFQRRSFADYYSGWLADSRNKGTVARRDHEIVDCRKVHSFASAGLMNAPPPFSGRTLSCHACRRDNLSHSVGNPAIGFMFQAVTSCPAKVRRTICPSPTYLETS